MSLRSTALLAALTVALVIGLPATAPAATTIGSNLTHAPNFLNCQGAAPAVNACSYAITALAPESVSAGGAVAPTSGVVVRWRIRAASSVATYLTANLHVLSGDTSKVRSPALALPIADTVNVQETRLPIAAGDRIGTTVSGISNNLFVVAIFQFANASPSPGSSLRYPTPLIDGTTQTPTPLNNVETLLNADIEPDVDGDGFGDESQDQCTTSPLAQSKCSPATITLPRFKRAEGFSLSLSEAATLNVQIQRMLPGRIAKNSKCSTRARKGKKCSLIKQVKSFVNLAAAAGIVSVPFAPKKLADGNYRATFTATTRFDQVSISTLNFKVKAPRRGK